MDAAALQAWREGMRAELLARRAAIAPEARQTADLAISLHLLHSLPLSPGETVGFCWPWKGEYDARRLMRALRDRGVRNALPVVKGRAQPLVFRAWQPGAPMERGALGIPAPAASCPAVDPELLLVPVVGFGNAGDRLGYGGGYFDRTLAVAVPQPLAIGVGYECSAIPSTYPQAHDILLDAIVTEAGVRMPQAGALAIVTAAEARSRLADLAGSRLAEARAATTGISQTLQIDLR